VDVLLGVAILGIVGGIVGVILLVVSARERPWRWPFVWILLAPLATVPLTAWMLEAAPQKEFNCDFFGCSSLVPLGHALASLWPGIFNLVPLFWLLSLGGACSDGWSPVLL